MSEPFQTTEKELSEQLNQIAAINEVSRIKAASIILHSQPAWYLQTPEGKYLAKIATGEK